MLQSATLRVISQLGCRNAADEEEKTWWEGLWEFHDRYTADGMSLVLGDPTEGKFFSITPQKQSDRTL